MGITLRCAVPMGRGRFRFFRCTRIDGLAYREGFPLPPGYRCARPDGLRYTRADGLLEQCTDIAGHVIERRSRRSCNCRGDLLSDLIRKSRRAGCFLEIDGCDLLFEDLYHLGLG